MNKCIMSGRAVRDAEVRYSQSDTSMAIARFTIAVNRRRQQGSDGQTADFINCIAFGKLGEFADKYVKKGVKFEVTGHLQTGSYTNKDGVKVYTTDLIVEEMEFAESKASNANAAQADASSAPAEMPQQVDDDFINIPENIADELPFN